MTTAQVDIRQTRLEDADALELLQQRCYPSLDPSHLFRREHIISQVGMFPAGQHVAIIGDQIVGMSSSLRRNIDLAHAQHAFDDMIASGYFTNHEPAGEWLYGADMSTLPEFRQRGIASALYAARKALIKDLNLRGMVGGGMVPGYRFHKDQMSLAEYAAKVATGELKDPTLTPQLRNGYTVRGIIHDYLHDAELGNDATLIVWDNPDYQA
jgi:GNAT superfamily N-acetyltransferase